MSNFCIAATVSNLNATYNNGSSGIDATLTMNAFGALSVDGVSLSLGDAVLVKDQTSSLENGIYIVTVVGDGGTAGELTRASYYSSAYMINGYGVIAVSSGAVNGFTDWILNSTISSVGVDNIVYSLSYKQYGSLGSKYVYVDANGSDTTGTGTQVAPFATVSHAESVITTATSTSPFTIYINGTINDTNIVKKAFINWEGVDKNSSYVRFNSFTAGASLKTAGAYCAFSNITLTNNGVVPLTIDTGSSAFSTTINFSYCQLNSDIEFDGPAAAILLINIKNGCIVTGTVASNDATLNSITTSFLSIVSVSAVNRSAAWTSLSDNINSIYIDGGSGFSCAASLPESLLTLPGSSTVTGADASLTYGPVINPSSISLLSGGTLTPAFVIGSDQVTYVYVDGTAGNNQYGTGSAISPFANISKALTFIGSNATSSSQYVIRLNGTSYESTLALKPWISIVGYGISSSFIVITTGGHNVTLDATFLSETSPTIDLIGIRFVSTNLSLDLTGGVGSDATININNCYVEGTTTITGREIGDAASFYACQFIGAFTVSNIPYVSKLNSFTGTATFNVDTASGTKTARCSADKYADITISNTGGHIVELTANGCNVTSGVSVSGAAAFYTYDAVSYPIGGSSLSSSGSVKTVAYSGYLGIGNNTYTGATYTFVSNDQGLYIQFNRATAQTITVPTNASVAFPTGTEIRCIQLGAGQVTFAPAGGVTINSVSGILSLARQYSECVLKKIGTNTWNLTGDLSKPAFFAYLGSTANNKTGNGASYTLGTDALTEIYDTGNNFNTNGTFTAPSAGYYDLRSQITITGTTVVTALTIVVSIVTTAKTYTQKFNRTGLAADQSVELSIIAQMASTDTATTTIVVTGEAADTDDILGSASPVTFFCGALVT